MDICFLIRGQGFESQRQHVPMTFLVMYIWKRLEAILLANGEGNLRDETCTSKKVHGYWKMCDGPKPHLASVANYSLNPTYHQAHQAHHLITKKQNFIKRTLIYNILFQVSDITKKYFTGNRTRNLLV